MSENSMNNAVTMRPNAGTSLGRIDQYELIRELGGGGFGCVYLARDTVAGIEVAVKGLPPLVRLNKEELENVRKNFALVSRLYHPNIAAALHFQKVQSAVYNNDDVKEKLRVFKDDPLVVMQYARGVTLSQWRKQFPDGKVPLDKALEITRQIASALDYAHKEKILHRDIKPANVMIETGADGSLTARVLDFGLAAEIRSSMSRVSQSITDTSGTRPYMAPEQWLGREQGKETDLYALAVLFNELVTGKVPFASVFDTGDPVLMMNVVGREEPEVSSDLPKTIRLALTKALAKKREDRFELCLEFVEALMGGMPRSKTFGRTDVPASRARGLRSAAIISAVAALSLAIGGVWYWQQGSSDPNMNAAREFARPPMREYARPPVDDQTEKAEAERRQKEESGRRLWEGERPREPQDSVSEDVRKAQDERQQAVAKLFNLRTQIRIKIDDAKGRMEKVADYRGEADGFQKHLNSIDEKWRIVETADRTPSNVGDAEKVLQSLTDVDSVIAQELEWLKTNKSARDGAKAIEREIAGSLEGELNLFKASDYARSVYNDGMRHRKEGNAAFEAGDFSTAREKLTAAKEKLSTAVNEAKAFCIKTHLDSAELFLKSSKWQMCVDEAEKVLKWDSHNAKANNFKNMALQRLVPSLKVIATIDGEEVRGARLNDGQKNHILPTTLKFERGENYGPYKIVYERGEKSYEGRLDAMSADWHGLKLQMVALKEEVQAKVQLWEGGPYWATMNIGAEKPEDSGYYFWWGDTVGYKRVGKKWVAAKGYNTNFSFSGDNVLTYGKSIFELEREGWIEKKNGTYVLISRYDAAQAHWGGDWRMPTKDEFDDLLSKCDWTWTTRNGKNGYVVRGRGNYESKSIFLPAAGFGYGASLGNSGSSGYYWSSVPYSDSYYAYGLYFYSSYRYTFNYSRYDGQSVRPVQGFTK